MRILICALGLAVGLSTSRASADVSKAWAAAKNNLPSNTQFFVAIDVAALYKQPLFPKVFEAIKSVDKSIGEVHGAFKQACGWDPLSVIDGVVIAGDPNQRHGVAVYVQLTIDRTKASACLASALKALAKGEQVSIEQDGVYTVATAGTGKNDTAYFPWVAPNIVMISDRPEKKDLVDQWFNQKTFAKSLVAGQLGNLDTKAVATGAFASDKPLDDEMPVTKAYGNITISSAGKIVGNLVATASDAAAAKSLADGMTKDMQREMQRDKMQPTAKKIFAAISVTAAGNDLTVRGSTTAQDVLTAFNETVQNKKDRNTMDEKAAKEALDKMEAFSKRMCGCKTKACADKVQDDLIKWSTEMAKQASSSRPTADLAKRTADITARYAECMAKIMTAEQKP